MVRICDILAMLMEKGKEGEGQHGRGRQNLYRKIDSVALSLKIMNPLRETLWIRVMWMVKLLFIHDQGISESITCQQCYGPHCRNSFYRSSCSNVRTGDYYQNIPKLKYRPVVGSDSAPQHIPDQ